jgi:hypothetical protein
MVPHWVSSWCRAHLGSEPVDVLHESAHMSEVFGLRLADGRAVAVKARPDQNGREATCVEVQRFLAAQGFPAAAPLTGVTVDEGRAARRVRDRMAALVLPRVLGDGDWETQNMRWQVAWAASLWTALHNARAEALHGSRPVALAAVRTQAADRLRLAGA